MLKKFTQTDRYGNMMSKEMDGKFLKKKVMKDRHGNHMAFEFAVPESNVPPVNKVPQYSAEGGTAANHPGGPKGSDTVPAWLTPGEFVVNKEATDLFGDTIRRMNEVGRQIQDQKGAQEDGLKQVPNVVYANKGEAILRLENNPDWQKQLNHMLEKYKGPYFNKERLYAMMAGESGMTDPSEKNPKKDSTASGLFQFTETPLKDMRRKGLVPKDFTTANIRAMDEVEQLKLYEKYLDMWGYQGNVHLGIMQAAPGKYTKAKNASKDGTINPQDIVYEEGSEGYIDNPQWIDKDSGLLTWKSISDYSDRMQNNSVIKNALAKIKDNRIPYGVNIGPQLAKAGMTPPLKIPPHTQPPVVQAGLNASTSGAQSFPKIPSDTIPTDTALNIQPGSGTPFIAGPATNTGNTYLDPKYNPTNLSVPNYAAYNPMGSNAPAMASMEPIAGPSSGRIAELMGNLQPSPAVNVTPGNNQNVTLDIAQMPGVNPMMDNNNPLGQPVPVRVVDGKQVALTPEYLAAMQNNDMGGLGADSQVFKDFVGSRLRVPTNQAVPPNLSDPAYMENFSPQELNNYIPKYSPEVDSGFANEFTGLGGSNEQNVKAPAGEFDWKAAQEKNLMRTHNLYNQEVWNDPKIEEILGTEYAKGFIESEEEYYNKLEHAENIKKNKENRVLDQWERKDNNNKINEKLKKEEELKALIKRLDGTVDPKLKAIVKKEIEKTEKAIKDLDDSIVKNVDESGWSTDIEPEANEFSVDDPNVFLAKKSDALENTINKTEGSKSPDENDKDDVETKGKNASKAEQSKAMGFLKDMFGSLFNKQELKRMAVMYLGSRLMGYDHGGSLNYAAKNYIARVDALEASRLKFAHSDEAKNWNNVDEYLKTGDFSVMTKKGAPMSRQGVFKKFFHKKTRKAVDTEKVFVGTGDSKQIQWIDLATGKPITTSEYSEDGLYSANSKDRNEAISKYTPIWTKILEDTKQAIITDIGEDSYNRVAGQLVLSNAASEALNEMLDKGADMGRAQEALSMALRLAVESENAKGKKALNIRSLKAALKALYVERGTGLGDLFKTRPDKRREKDWDGVSGNKDFMDLVEFEKMRRNATMIVKTIPKFKDMNDDEAANLYLEDLAKLWAGVRTLPDGKKDPDNLDADDRKDFWMKTGENESGFFHFLRQQLILENEKRLGMK